MRSVSAFRSFFCILHTVNVFAGRNRRNAAVRARCHKLSYGFVLQPPAAKISGLEVLQSSPERIKPLSSSFTSSANTAVVRRKPNGNECAADRKLPFLTRFTIFNNDSGKLAFPDEARNGAVQNRLNVCAGSKSVRNMFFGTKFAAAVNQINLAANL